MRLSHFQNESYITQLFTGQFSPREPKCPNGVAVRDGDGQFIFSTNHTSFKVVIIKLLRNLMVVNENVVE